MFRRIIILLPLAASLVAIGARAEDRVDFERQILPIFHANCVKCHGEAKQQGKMSLQSAASLQTKWDADEHLLVAGQPDESELFERITLPANSPKRMPKGTNPLPQAEIDLIRAWIDEGALLTATAANSSTATDDVGDHTSPANESHSAEPVLPDVAPAPPEAIERLTAAGARVMPLCAGSALLEVSLANRSEPMGDAEIALLADVAEQVYSLNLADCTITDAGLAPVARLKNLTALHLERSNVTDAALGHLAGLTGLQYLNLYGTGISDAGLAQLTGLKQLRRIYLWQTNVSFDAAMALEGAIPGLIVNLGFDHPVVARERLTQELQRAKQQADDAKAKLKAAKQQLDWAQKDSEAGAARVADIEKQLKELSATSDGS